LQPEFDLSLLNAKDLMHHCCNGCHRIWQTLQPRMLQSLLDLHQTVAILLVHLTSWVKQKLSYLGLQEDIVQVGFIGVD
jgi:hypothetical protein